jgi:hypothetical protein
LIAACLLAVNASEFFTQDVEDFINTPAGAGALAPAPSAAPSYDEQRASGSVIAGSKKFSSGAAGEVGPGVDASDLRGEILAACRRLGKTEEQLADWLGKKYEVAGLAGLTLQQKREVLAFLHNKIARERAA